MINDLSNIGFELNSQLLSSMYTAFSLLAFNKLRFCATLYQVIADSLEKGGIGRGVVEEELDTLNQL